MYESTAAVINQAGLHARPATMFVQKAEEFKSSVTVEYQEGHTNGKSLLGILSLGINQGAEILIRANGPDEKAAVDALRELVASGFAE